MDSKRNKTNTPTLENREAEARIEKIQLEQRALKQQLSVGYWVLESLKVLAGAAAVAALFISFVQWRGNTNREQSIRDEARFESALERLTGDAINERIAGVALLSLFLTNQDSQWHPQILLSLTYSLASEPDPVVRGAIFEAFRNIDEATVSKELLNEVLSALASMGRTVVDEGSKDIGVDIARVISVVADKADSNFSGVYCPGCDFAGVDFRHANLNGANLNEATLSGADLSAADLTRANLVGAILTNSNLSKANLRSANLSSADLNKAALTETNLSDTILIESTMMGANLSKADLSKADLSRANLSKAYLDFATLTESTLNGTDLTGAILNDAILYMAFLGDADFAKANLSRANLNDADLPRTNFSNAILIETKLGVARLEDAIFTDANLSGADLNSADLVRTDFTRSNLTRANLSFAVPTEANFSDAILTGADLTETNITVQQLRSAKSFEGAILPSNATQLLNSATNGEVETGGEGKADESVSDGQD